MLSKRPRSIEELSIILVGTGVTALKMWKDSPFEKVIVLASMNDTFKIGACRSRGQCQAQLSCRGSLVRWVESWSQFNSLFKVRKKCFVYFSFTLLNWVMQPFILLPGTGQMRLKLSTRLPLLCKLKYPQVSTDFAPRFPSGSTIICCTNGLQCCLRVEIMIQARNHTHILKRNEMLHVFCHLREEDNNILEWFFFPHRERITSMEESSGAWGKW